MMAPYCGPLHCRQSSPAGPRMHSMLKASSSRALSQGWAICQLCRAPGCRSLANSPTKSFAKSASPISAGLLPAWCAAKSKSLPVDGPEARQGWVITVWIWTTSELASKGMFGWLKCLDMGMSMIWLCRPPISRVMQVSQLQAQHHLSKSQWHEDHAYRLTIRISSTASSMFQEGCVL